MNPSAAVSKQAKSRQFYLLMAGLVLSSVGTSMIWPFLMTYAKNQLNLPMVVVTSLMTINSLMGFLGSVVAGPQLDLRGRRPLLILGLIGTSLAYLGYIGAQTYWRFALSMALTGLFSPLYRIASAAMITDWFSAEERPQAFAYYRTAGNLGFALGPLIGGYLLAKSFNYGIYAASSALALYCLICLVFIPESLPVELRSSSRSIKAQFQEYLDSFRDRRFLQVLGAYSLIEISARLVWVLLATYMSTTLGFPPSYYGWVAMTNGLMIVFLQLLVTKQTRKHPEIKVLPVGAFFYCLALITYGLVRSVYGFIFAMVIMTIGEMINAPTASTYVSNIAPVTKRGQYLSVFNLTWFLSLAVGPVGGGFMVDAFSPQAPFFGGAIVALVSALLFLQIGRSWKASPQSPPQA